MGMHNTLHNKSSDFASQVSFMEQIIINIKQMQCFLLQLIPAIYRTLKGADEAEQELHKQLAELENELKNGNKKFIGGEPFIFKQLI